ncbi:cyclin domain-containing protein [Rutstroemia sp. NJR-2017a BVV2]|nr:cyclin domain-containing protein [Rutstroemia sp. NJR-2017a BVV2]
MHQTCLPKYKIVFDSTLCVSGYIRRNPLPHSQDLRIPTLLPKHHKPYITYRTRLLTIEGHILHALGFNTHVALPHPLAITYLQILDAFSPSSSHGKALAKRTLRYLNTALLSPQMLYLTHQPCALAIAAIYLAAREEGVKMPEHEWWEVFDMLGFLVVGMRSVEGVARRGREVFGGVGVLGREDVRKYLVGSGEGGGKNGDVVGMRRMR